MSISKAMEDETASTWAYREASLSFVLAFELLELVLLALEQIAVEFEGPRFDFPNPFVNNIW